MAFEKDLRSVSRAASQRLGIFRMSWHVFCDRLLLGRCFRDFVLPVLEYCSAVWCSDADTHLKLLGRVVTNACFLTDGVLYCSLVWQFGLYKIRCNPVYPHSSALPVPYVPVRIIHTRCFGRTSAHLRASALQNLTVMQDFCPLSVPLWNAVPCFRWCETGGFKV